MAVKNKPTINVVIENDRPVTTSRNIADVFERKHQHVLEAIDNLTVENSTVKEMFAEDTYTNTRGRKYRQVLMNRDGFTLLAMGFTGKKAMSFKLAYIEKFNEMEQQLRKQLPGTYKEALLQLVEEVEQKEKLELENKELKPKADYFDKYIQNKGVMTIGIIAENYGMSPQSMNKLLNELGIQYKQGDTWRLYIKYKDKGYAHMDGFQYKDKNGNLKINPTLKWHPKGHHFIYELLKKEGILPMIEREAPND